MQLILFTVSKTGQRRYKTCEACEECFDQFNCHEIYTMILGRQAEYIVHICRSLVRCSCPFFSRSSTNRKKVSWKHIIWVMFNILHVPEKSDLLLRYF